MKTMAEPRAKEEILTRLQSVRPSSARQWGKMSPHQMICHLSDGFKMYMGLRTTQPVGFPYPSRILKFVALWSPLPWPKGFKTVPELDQMQDGTAPSEFDRDIEELRQMADRFTRRPRDFEWQSHPHFGRMSEKDWMRLAYLHCDHHLRQFGA
jgi:hypothetical protein